jgi:hypothetical protein
MEINTSPMKITVKRNRKPTKQSEKASKIAEQTRRWKLYGGCD